MESSVSQDPAALALQIQSLVATVEELTRQNQEMKQRLQQENNARKSTETTTEIATGDEPALQKRQTQISSKRWERRWTS